MIRQVDINLSRFKKMNVDARLHLLKTVAASFNVPETSLYKNGINLKQFAVRCEEGIYNVKIGTVKSPRKRLKKRK